MLLMYFYWVTERLAEKAPEVKVYLTSENILIRLFLELG